MKHISTIATLMTLAFSDTASQMHLPARRPRLRRVGGAVTDRDTFVRILVTAAFVALVVLAPFLSLLLPGCVSTDAEPLATEGAGGAGGAPSTPCASYTECPTGYACLEGECVASEPAGCAWLREQR